MQELITLSSKGQFVIPKRIREEAHFQSGDQFMMEWDGQVLQLRKVTYPDSKPKPSLVRELLGKYQAGTKDGEADLSPRAQRDDLYGKITD